MALQPIDLQVLFTQLDKVAKNQALQKEGLQIQTALQAMQNQQKAEERVQSVNEVQNTGDGPEKVNDRAAHQNSSGGGRGEHEPPEGEEETGHEPRFIKDPALGKNIDFNGQS
jgi:hypothetical protein